MGVFPTTFYYLLTVLYLILFIYTIIRILLDTHSSSKTLAYILLASLFPIVGIAFYFSFGINYRHQSRTKKGLNEYRLVSESFKQITVDETEKLLAENASEISHFSE